MPTTKREYRNPERAAERAEKPARRIAELERERPEPQPQQQQQGCGQEKADSKVELLAAGMSALAICGRPQAGIRSGQSRTPSETGLPMS